LEKSSKNYISLFGGKPASLTDHQIDCKFKTKIANTILLLCYLDKICCLSRTVKNILTPNALKSLYYSLIHCHLIYASPIWSICNQQLQNDLFKKQKLAIRAIAGLKYNGHTEPHFKKLEILPIPSLIDFFSI
jgi:hypothetical protein